VDVSSSGEEGDSLPVTGLGSLADQLAVGREYPVYFEAGQVRLASLIEILAFYYLYHQQRDSLPAIGGHY
jgi:hypothetical protein